MSIVHDRTTYRESNLLKLASIPQIAQNAGRMGDIIAILGKYGLADWIHRLDWNFAKGHLRSQSGLDLCASRSKPASAWRWRNSVPPLSSSVRC